MNLDYKSYVMDKGYLVIEDFINDDVIKSVKDAVQNYAEQILALNGNKSTRHINLLGTHSVFDELVTDQAINRIAQSVVGKHVNLIDFEVLTLHPGATAIGPHIDYPYLLMDRVFCEPVVSLQTLWALDDFTETNGATLIVPESHKECRWPDESFTTKCQPLLLKRGSVVIMHGAMWHGTMSNQSEYDRSSILMSFGPPWVKPLSQLDANVVDQSRYMHPRMRELLGYNNKLIIHKYLKTKQKHF